MTTPQTPPPTGSEAERLKTALAPHLGAGIDLSGIDWNALLAALVQLISVFKKPPAAT